MRDEPIRSGQYWHVATRVVDGHCGKSAEPHSYLAEVTNDVWVPFDQERDWLMDRRITGQKVWIKGSEEQAANAGFEMKDQWPTGRWRARHGDFWAESAGREPSPREGTWQTPTLDFLAALPRDSSQLLDQLQESSPQRAGDSGVFAYATDVLRSGIVPADLRAALYRALLMIPGVEIVNEGASGRDFSLGIQDGIRRNEILISGENGQFARERATFTRDIGDFRAGTVQTSTKVATTVVGRMLQA